MDSERRAAFLESLLGRLLGSVAAADAKSGAIFATDTAMLGLLAALAPRFLAWRWYEAALAAVAAACLLSSILVLSFAAFPRVTGPKHSLLFFGSICKRPLSSYLDDVGSLTLAEYLKDLGSQCHRNAEIASRKYFWIKLSMKAMYAALPFWLFSVFLLYRRKP